MTRLDTALDHLVDQGRLPAELAEEVRHEYHAHHGDVRSRLAELAAYAGAALAVTGVIVIGSQLWSDIGQVLRAAVPALLAAALLLATWELTRHTQTPVRGRLAQVTGVCAAVLAALATAVALAAPPPYDDRPWQPFLALGTGAVVALLVSRWAPGFVTTLASGLLVAGTCLSGLAMLPLHVGGPGPAGLVLVALGVLGSLVAARAFEPSWLMRLMGITGWVFGCLMLLMSQQEYEAMNHPQPVWTWIGRVSALALVVGGSWLFARGGDWPWAVGAAISAAMLVGLWSATATNAGIALIVAGLVLIGVGAGLARGRQVFGSRHTKLPAKMGS